MANQEQEVLPASDYLGILKRRRATAALTATAVFGALAAYAFLSTPVYRASALVDIERVSDGVPNLNGYQPPDEDYLATQAKLIVSVSALEKTYEELKLDAYPEFSGGVLALSKSVSVLALPRTRLVHVNAESNDPGLAALIANSLTERFVRQNLNNQLFMPKDVLAALRTRARGPDARKIYESLPAVINNPVIQNLKSQILKGELELADLRTKYTPDHPAVRGVEHQLRLMRAARDEELDNVVRSVTTALSGQLRPNNVRVVDAARPPLHPARPRRVLALALGLIGGLGLGFLAALARESLDQTVRTHQDVERKLGLSVLGHIPLSRPRRGEKIYGPLVADRQTTSSEAFRDLRTMVAIARRADDPFLLVTSPRREEGKTFVATNLAVSLSQLGDKVLIIDGDLRSPSERGVLCDPESPGLVDFLAGRVSDPASLAQATDVPNLDVLAAGGRPTNASELLNSSQMADLLAWARDRYDRVIVDCPPVLAAGDVLLWGRHVGSSILVSRSGRTQLPQALLARERLRVGGIDVLGGVLNGSAS
jgi:capsular exopolysaccharide synthesis family protein